MGGSEAIPLPPDSVRSSLMAHRSDLAENHKTSRLNRNAFPITETELKLIAAAAIMGLSNRPNAG